MPELLNCPFCGGANITLLNGGPGNRFVHCDDCRTTTDDGSEERAIAAWNRRAPAVAAGGVTEAQVRAAAEGLWRHEVHDIPAGKRARDGMKFTDLKEEDQADYCSFARAALTAALAVEGIREGWQPIETARKVVDETVLLRIEHVNFAVASADDKHRWEEIVTAYWTDFNGGGWVWHGLAGSPTDWRPLPTPPSRGEGV